MLLLAVLIGVVVCILLVLNIFVLAKGRVSLHQTQAAAGQKTMIVLIAEIAALFLLTAFLFQNTANLFDAEKIGERYFAAVVNGDWEAAYPMLEVEDSADQIVAKNCVIQVPSGASASVDGIGLTEQTASLSREDGYDIYTIPALFKGDHTGF